MRISDWSSDVCSSDLAAEAEWQRASGRPIKDRVEISASGRVRQTAFQADPVVRRFRDGSTRIERTVPGSFYEIITRDIDPETGKMDLRFEIGRASCRERVCRYV